MIIINMITTWLPDATRWRVGYPSKRLGLALGGSIGPLMDLDAVMDVADIRRHAYTCSLALSARATCYNLYLKNDAFF